MLALSGIFEFSAKDITLYRQTALKSGMAVLFFEVIYGSLVFVVGKAEENGC